MPINFYQAIDESLRQHLTDPLIIWPNDVATSPDRTYTGRDVLDRVAVWRNELAIRRVQPGQQVLLAMPVSFDLICGLLASMALGVIPVLPPAAASSQTLFNLLRQGDIRAIMTQQKLPRLVAWVVGWLGVTPVCADTNAQTPLPWLRPLLVQPDQPALLTHSSGSTGKAKQIRRSHQVLLAQHQALTESFPPWPGQRDFPLFPNILLHNLALGTVSILPALPGFQLDQLAPERIVQQLVDHRVQTMTGNVYYYQALLTWLTQHPHTFTHVRALGIGGSPVPEGLAFALTAFFTKAAIYIIYGSSEAEPIAIRRVGAETENPRAGYAVGTIHPAIQVAIQPMGTLVLPDGTTPTVGEIAVKGAHVAQPGTDWFLTGDVGYLDAANQLILTGRKGNERIHEGVQHYQIEHVLAQVAGVVRVAAHSEQRGFTVYVEGNAPEADLWRVLNSNFPKSLVNHLYFPKSLPVDARHRSKIRYDALRPSADDRHR